MAIYRQRWMESVNDPNMGIYSVEQVLTSSTPPNPSHNYINFSYAIKFKSSTIQPRRKTQYHARVNRRLMMP